MHNSFMGSSSAARRNAGSFVSVGVQGMPAARMILNGVSAFAWFLLSPEGSPQPRNLAFG